MMTPVTYPEVLPLPINEAEAGYREARTAHFVGVALRHRDAWQQQKDNGQFDVLKAHVPTDEGAVVREIRATAAVQHCLVQGARAKVIGSMLGLSDEGTHDLEKAAVLHDSYKGKEVVAMLEQGPSWDSYERAQAAARASWETVTGRFTSEVMDIAGSVAHESISDMVNILGKDDDALTETDKAKLAMHYLDDYTVEYNWANPAQDGLNDLDHRMVKNENNARYKALNETGRQHFDGETAYQAQRRVGHLVESRLASLIAKNSGVHYNPLDLPVAIDNQIKLEIVQNIDPRHTTAA